MKFTINKKFILGKVEEKGTVNLYTLLDVDTLDKVVSIGGKFKDLTERKTYDVEITIRMSAERFETKSGERKYLDVANTFISKFEEVAK
ncbi:hypothetical protein LG296_21260 (plasmid) [Ureibacillus chungkukjangi]|uniref:hypothetical protein n=1 Tax=Ureibacillus chungkukjangi TaxID=1202712 RepID=UPI00384F013A